jgi:large subunit ribosomal protein L25
MITDTVIQAIPREERGKNAARRVRAAGRIPAAVYGVGLEAIPVSVNARELGVLLRSEAGRHAIFTLAIEGKDSSPVKIHQMDLDPVTSRLIHMDLMRISLTEKTQVSVPLQFVGEPVGVKDEGGILEAHLHELDVECLPRDIPGHIDVDVSGLGIGDRLTVGDVHVDTDVITIVTDADHLLVAVSAPRLTAEEQAEDAEAAAAAEAEAASAEEPAAE